MKSFLSIFTRKNESENQDQPIPPCDNDWEINPKWTDVGNISGTGRFGDVYHCNVKGIGAVRTNIVEPEKLRLHKLTIRQFFKEAKVWMKITHPNLIKMIGVCSKDPYYVMFEVVEANLHASMLRRNLKPNAKAMIHIALQVAQGMDFLASQRFVHRGLGAVNILVPSVKNWTVKIYCLWNCKKMKGGVYNAAQDPHPGPSLLVNWTAPEAELTKIYSTKSDVWSFGILLMEMITHGCYPQFHNYDSYSVTLSLHRREDIEKIKERVPEFLFDLMLECLQMDDVHRPSFAEIKERLIAYSGNVDEAIYNEAYLRALEHGKVVNRRIPIMIVGQDRSGKTSLRKHLQGVVFDQEEPSTCGIEVDVVELNNVNVEETWNKKQTEQFIMSESEAKDEVIKQAANFVDHKPTEATNTDDKHTVQELAEAEVGPELSVSEQVTREQNITSTSFEVVETPQPEEIVPETLSKEMIDGIKDMEKSVNKKCPPVTAFVHDLAGQNVFHDTHHCFLKLQCPYIVVHDLRVDFDSPAQPRFKSKNINVERNLNNPLLATNLDFFLSWLTVLNKLRETANRTIGVNFPTFKVPPVLIALTNADRFDGDVNEVKQRIKYILTEKGFDNVFTEPYVIDNTSANRDEIKKLRKVIYDLCEMLLGNQPPLPLRWFQFEASLSKKMMIEKVTYISIEEARKVAESCKVQDVDAAIRFLHHQGVLVYHTGSPVVILNPVWLMNLFTQVITVPQENIPSNACCRQLMTKGILMQKYLRARDHGEILEELMLRFGLICPWQYNDQPAFIVPSVAPLMVNGKDIDEQLSSSPISPLFLRFRHGYMLSGIFTRYLVSMIKKFSKFLCNNQPRLFCNYTLLSIKHCDIEFDVYVIKQLAGIKVGVVPRGSVSDSELVIFAAYLKQVTIESIESIKEDKDLFYQNIDVMVSMKCSACFGETSPCLRHGNEKCHFDDCGHFWGLEELQGYTQDPICEFGSVVQTRKFPLSHVKPWFGIADEGKTNASNLKSITCLDLLKRQRICRKLDILMYSGDFRDLAGHLGMSNDDLCLISQNDQPTNEVLKWAERNPWNTIEKLREIFVKMERDDCLDIIDKC